VLWRLSVAQTAPVLDLPWPQLVEWHGGLRWLWAPLQAGARLQAAAKAAGGNATVFVAARADAAGAKCPNHSQSAGQGALLKRLKAAFDPAGIFNPGRLYSDL
ncbi:MAG: glycolate oxidase subunit GlcE, partial [Betaproteobacteria bacterium]|nr:glycolate oxidase subunit GlcE [Betaproteobacteria bacterium]